jgi:hypothetical protein
LNIFIQIEQKFSKAHTSNLLSEDWKSSRSTAKNHPRFMSAHLERSLTLNADHLKRETKMSSTKTISMNEVHRRASPKITLHAKQSPTSNPNDATIKLKSSRRFQVKPPCPHSNVKLPETQAVYAWLDNCSRAQAFWKVPENQDQRAVHSSMSPSNLDGSRSSEQPVSMDKPRRPTLEQRFAALRRALAGTNQSVSANSAAESPANRKAEPLPDIDATSSQAEEEDEQIVFHPRLTRQLSTSKVPASGLRTPISSNTYLTELSNNTNPGHLMTDAKADVVDFVVLDPDLQPLTKLGWLSVAPSGSIFGGKLLKGHIRRHAAAKFKVEPRSFGLWYDKWPCDTEPSITPIEDRVPRPCRVTVGIMCDPYIRLIFGEEIYTLDCSHHYFHKVNMQVGVIRKEVRANLNVPRDQELILYFEEKELIDDRISLKDTGLLSSNVCQGLEPLYLRAETKTRYKTCIGTRYHSQKI